MVTAKAILDLFPIKPATFYRMVNDGRIPYHDVTQPWHRRRQLRFVLSEVEPVLTKHAA